MNIEYEILATKCMSAQISKIKEKMLEFTQLFCLETNVFQRFVIVYKYIRLLRKDPLVKDVLQQIFDETVEIMGQHGEEELDEESFIRVKGDAILSRQFWMYYHNLEMIYRKMKKMKSCGIDDKEEFDDLCKLFSKPYSRDMLELSFKVVNSEVFEELDKKSFFDKNSDETTFDKKRSVLYIKGKKILINKQDRITNAHKLLHHIFVRNKKNTNDDFFYSEIADEEFGDFDYSETPSRWKRYHRASEYVNKKVNEQTDGDITDFLVYNTGKRGKVHINKKYL